MEKCNVGEFVLSSWIYFFVSVTVVNGHSWFFSTHYATVTTLRQNKNSVIHGYQKKVIFGSYLDSCSALLAHCASTKELGCAFSGNCPVQEEAGLHGTLLSPRSYAPGVGGLN